MNKTNSSHVVILTILIIVALGILVYKLANKSDNPSAANPTNTFVPSNEKDQRPPVDTSLKAEILAKVSTKNVLSAKDKAFILDAIAGDKINNFDFNDAEKQKIVEALNRK